MLINIGFLENRVQQARRSVGNSDKRQDIARQVEVFSNAQEKIIGKVEQHDLVFKLGCRTLDRRGT